MKRIFGFILLLVMVLLLTTCTNNNKQGDRYLCRYFIFSYGMMRYNYLIEVTDSGVMTISSGDVSDDVETKIIEEEEEKMTESLSDYKFLKNVHSKDTVRLTHSELERLRKCIDKIADVKLINPFVEYMWTEYTAHIIIINENKLVFQNAPSEDFGDFLTTLTGVTRREFKDADGYDIEFGYDERWVYEGHRNKSCWERIKGWFE